MSDLSAYGSSIRPCESRPSRAEVSEAFHVSSCKIPGVGSGPGSREAKDPDADSRWHDLG